MAQLKNLIVNGVARIVGKVFASEFVGKLTGNSDTATRVANNIAIKLNGGTKEGTNLFTFNGSAAKTVNITPASIGAKETLFQSGSHYINQEQWITITFPIAFDEVPKIIIVPTGRETHASYQNVTTTNFQAWIRNSSNIYWIAVGYKKS